VSESDPIRLFVIHYFQEDADYQRVFEYLESREKFFYINSAAPDQLPAESGSEAIKEELRRQIDPAEVLILPVTAFEQNRDLVKFQMDVAQAANKPILAIQSFGGTVAIQQEVLSCSADVVEWNDRVITDAISRLARNEASGQWEVIDFNLD
jgi:hypothetical protein